MKSIASTYRKVIATIAQYITRAKNANLVQLPKAYKSGANCRNCHYWKETGDPEIGYCWKPEVSVFVTDRQVCGVWAADGTISKWDKIKVILQKDFRDRPPALEGLELNDQGAVEYGNNEHIRRAMKVRMKTLPPTVKGANCAGCLFSNGQDKWCAYPKVNQAIEKNDKCKYWNHHDAQSLRENK